MKAEADLSDSSNKFIAWHFVIVESSLTFGGFGLFNGAIECFLHTGSVPGTLHPRFASKLAPKFRETCYKNLKAGRAPEAHMSSFSGR